MNCLVALSVATILIMSVLLPVSALAEEKKSTEQKKKSEKTKKSEKAKKPSVKKTPANDKKKLKPGLQPFTPKSKPEEPAKTKPDKPKLQTKSSTASLDLSGKWTGIAVWSAVFDYYDPDIGSYREVCMYRGNFVLVLNQNGNSVTGNAALNNVQVTQGRNMDVCAEEGFSTLGAVDAKIFGSGFSGTVGGLGIKGSVTSDLMNGQVSGSLGGEVGIDGKFTGNRVLN
jgi:hypothetical protein